MIKSSGHTFKRTKNLKQILLGCLVTVICWKVKKGLQLGPISRIKLKYMEMFFVSYSNISPNPILIPNRIQEKQQKMHFLICNNVHDDLTNFQFCSFMENTKIKTSLERSTMFLQVRK